MLETTKTELESLDEALEACSEVRIRLGRLATALQGKQKDEAVQVMDAAGVLAAILVDVSKKFQCVLAQRNKIQADTSTNHW